MSTLEQFIEETVAKIRYWKQDDFETRIEDFLRSALRECAETFWVQGWHARGDWSGDDRIEPLAHAWLGKDKQP